MRRPEFEFGSTLRPLAPNTAVLVVFDVFLRFGFRVGHAARSFGAMISR
jgi:hypothetical protein